MSARYNERVEHIEKLLLIQNLLIDTEELRRSCSYGIPDKFRALCWRLFLDYLPKDRQAWQQVLQKQRDYYENLVENLIINPSDYDDVGSGGDFSTILMEEEVDDHPLATSPPASVRRSRDRATTNSSSDGGVEETRRSEWITYFKDNEVLSQIDKDVRRLRPEMDFFQRQAYFPKKWSSFANLAKRVQFENLASDVPEINLFNKSFITSDRNSAPSSSTHQRTISSGSGIEKDNGNEPSMGGKNGDAEPELHWQVVERILFIYSKVNPGIKYVQGMNEIIGPLYYVFANDPDKEWAEHAEADAFYCFQNLMSEIKDIFIRTLDNSDCGIEAVLNRFHSRFCDMDPELYRHVVEELSIKPQFYAFRWISLLLSQEFSLPDLIELWDNVFSSKNRVESVEFICLAMIVYVRKELLNGDFSHDVRLLQNYPEVDLGHIIAHSMELRNTSGQHNNGCSLNGSITSECSDTGGLFGAKTLSLRNKLSNFVTNTQQRVIAKYSASSLRNSFTTILYNSGGGGSGEGSDGSGCSTTIRTGMEQPRPVPPLKLSPSANDEDND